METLRRAASFFSDIIRSRRNSIMDLRSMEKMY